MILSVESPIVESIFNATPWTILKPGLRVKSFVFDSVQYKKTEYYCQDCMKVRPKVFMVIDSVWNEVGVDGFICHDCFEERLGRTVDIYEYTDALCNDYYRVRKFNNL